MTHQDVLNFFHKAVLVWESTCDFETHNKSQKLKLLFKSSDNWAQGWAELVMDLVEQTLKAKTILLKMNLSWN